MADKLTPKQWAFAQKYVECSNASEAYRFAYDVGEGAKPETIWKEAYLVLCNPKVAAMVGKLQQEHRERHAVTVDSLTQELEEARMVATAEGQGAAMTSATMGKAKLHGLLVDKNEIKADLNVQVSKIEHTIIDPNATDTDS
jgi:phage terminase small subunit